MENTPLCYIVPFCNIGNRAIGLVGAVCHGGCCIGVLVGAVCQSLENKHLLQPIAKHYII